MIRMDRRIDRGPRFFVTATEGPLADRESERAEAWGTRLGHHLNGRRNARATHRAVRGHAGGSGLDVADRAVSLEWQAP
ncbi:hypothetical protein FRAHR75_330004 [Frankia sp. Hr75.2]|nr:hypothetical protein FRAHR75_330004 [Frankia sp. Hr75.2]